MMSPDLQRIKHIRDYCVAIAQTIERYGRSFEIYAADPDYQRSVSFCILQIGELSGALPARDDGISLTREMIRIFGEGKEPK